MKIKSESLRKSGGGRGRYNKHYFFTFVNIVILGGIWYNLGAMDNKDLLKPIGDHKFEAPEAVLNGIDGERVQDGSLLEIRNERIPNVESQSVSNVPSENLVNVRSDAASPEAMKLLGVEPGVANLPKEERSKEILNVILEKKVDLNSSNAGTEASQMQDFASGLSQK